MLMLRPLSALTTIKVLSASDGILLLAKHVFIRIIWREVSSSDDLQKTQYVAIDGGTAITDVGANDQQHQAVDFGHKPSSVIFPALLREIRDSACC